MAKEKFPHPSEIPWNSLKQLRISSGNGSYSFEFDIEGRRQKMTISISPGKTSFTISKEDGTPIVHATQSGKEVKILDFSNKPSVKGMSKKIKALKPRKR